MTQRRWIFADQLGPHFVDPDESVVLVESHNVWRRRTYHRAKALLILSAMRHRAADLGDRCTYLTSDTYSESIRELGSLRVSDPTSRRARRLVRQLGAEVEPARGFLTDEATFNEWAEARGKKRLLQEDFYRSVRTRHGILMSGTKPEGGQWNFDADNRQPPPKGQTTLGLRAPWLPTEDDIDAQVRDDIARLERSGVTFIGNAGPREFAVTRAEALTVLEDFVAHRLASFGPFEDAVMAQDRTMAHSRLSVPLNLGLLHPMEIVEAALAAYESGAAPLASVEGFIRQVIGWREYVWHLYWYLGADYAKSNALNATKPLPTWFAELRAEDVKARCLSHALAEVRDHGWNHHIERLMVLGNWALQRGYDPLETADWFRRVYLDGYEWVMSANVIGMALYADGGVMATKPYASGGAYIKRMTDFCKGCDYRPEVRVGDNACPFTAGYWALIDRIRPQLEGNHRMAIPLRGLERLADREAVIAQESLRGDGAP
jgi:deoxyribodipyrimidine photolyase-related protein